MFQARVGGYPPGMTTQNQSQDQALDPDQLIGEGATIANNARGQLTSFLDKLDALVLEGRDMLADMDVRLRGFDADSRRYDPTTEDARSEFRTGGV
jgi:hypothetical protein